MTDTTLIKRLKIASITHNEDGTSTIIFNLDDDFIEWFKEKEGLKRFSHKRFSKFVTESMKNYVNSDEKEFKGIVGKITSEQNI